MNYEKIGEFITVKRKSLGLTQKDLAEKLNITDRAVSRWERGLGCPDISLLEEVATILNVSVLDLLHGEELETKEKENQFMVSILNQSGKKIKWWKRIVFILLNSLLIFILSLYFFVFCFPKMIENNPNKFLYQVVLTDMEPTLKVYDWLLIHKKDIKEIQVSDMITYISTNGFTLTHRVIEKVSDENTGEIRLTTKGDNLSIVDKGVVTKENLIGVVEKRFPLAGRWLPIDVHAIFIRICFLLFIVGILLLDFIGFKNRKNL